MRCFSVPENGDAKEEGASTSSPEQVKLEIEWKRFTRWIRNSGIISSCLAGFLTGVVVVFNNAVHEIRDLFWDGIPYRGASWLRETPIEIIWKREILVPAFGGVIVDVLNLLRETPSFSASITLGTGNSLGPEGPSVEIGTSIAKWITSTSFFDVKGSSGMLPLLAAGSDTGKIVKIGPDWEVRPVELDSLSGPIESENRLEQKLGTRRTGNRSKTENRAENWFSFIFHKK